MASDPSETYEKLWVTDFFHNFPHIDFSFKVVNSTFDPKNDNYKQSLGFWALVPVAVCFLLWLVFLIYFIFRCCHQQKKKIGRHSCQRIFIGFLIVLGIALVSFGYYENENAHNGIEEVKHSRQSVNNLLTSASHRIEVLERISDDVSTKLSDALEKAVLKISNTTIRKNVVILIADIRQKASEAHESLLSIHIEETNHTTLDTILDYEYYRWMVTIVLFCVYMFIFLLALIGLIVRSKGTLIISTTLAVICSLFIWLATGAYLGVSVAAGDLCTDPDAYFISLAESSSAEDAMVAYIKCTDPTKPYKEVIDTALTSVSQAVNFLNETVRLAQPYNISGIDQPVSEMSADLHFASGNLSTLLSTVGMCPPMHQYYISGVNGVCTETISATALLALVCCVVGIVATITIFCLSCVWRQYAKQRAQAEYVTVDDKDPFLPRPPPYETDYGTMGQSSPRPWSERGTLQQNNGVTSDEQVMTLLYQQHPYPMDESPPPAYHPGRFPQWPGDAGPSSASSRPY